MESTKGMTAVSGGAVVFALLQSICTAVLTINGIRTGIGLAALTASTIAPLHTFHRDAIRIPMLLVAVVSALVDLLVLAWVRHLRNRSSAQWRRRELSPKQRRSEQFQIALAILTFALVITEESLHVMLHHHV